MVKGKRKKKRKVGFGDRSSDYSYLPRIVQTPYFAVQRSLVVRTLKLASQKLE